MPIKINHFRRDFNQWSLLLVAIGLFISIPLFSIALNLFDGAGEMWEHIVAYFLLDYIFNSVVLIIGTGLLSSTIGVSTAWIVSKYDFTGRRLLEWLLFLPLAIPSYILAYAYVGLLGNGGTLINGLNWLGISIKKIELMNLYGLIWVLSLSLFPYIYAGTRTLFQSLPTTIRDTAFLLGASSRRYFFSVALPLALPALIGGLFLVFMEVLNDYGAAKYYGINTFTTGIFRTWTALEDLPSAIYLSGLLVVLVLGLISLSRWLRGRKSYTVKLDTAPSRQSVRVPLTGYKRLFYPLIVALPVLFGFLLPLAQLLYWAMLTYPSIFRLRLLWTALQSFGVAIAAALLIVLTALAIIYCARWNNIRGLRSFARLSTIGYVIPGAIIGIGVISSSQTIIDFFSRNFQLQIGYLFYGSSIVLVYAYVFRFLAVAYNPIEANTLKVGKKLSEASYLLGMGRLKTLVKVDLPLLRSTLISALLLVFIDVLKELPLTLILKPYDLDTLAVTAYAYADDELVAESSLPALLLILLIGGLIIVLNNRKLVRDENTGNTRPV
ncbi:MAG: iron ABC transporter permease [Bacteroidota bacterium]